MEVNDIEGGGMSEFWEHPVDWATPMYILSGITDIDEDDIAEEEYDEDEDEYEDEGGVMPTSNKNLWLMENEAYSNKPVVSINEWSLLSPYSDGIKAFKKGMDIVVAIRGTADVRDVKADLQIVYSGITNSSRFKEDLKIIKQLQSKYPKKYYNYYGVGHSLGGAILDELIDMDYIKEGISYNPAVDLIKFKNDTRNHRIYNKDDILFNIMGRFTKNPEVRKTKKGFFKKMLSYTPLGKVGESISAHLLSNFEGGRLNYYLSLNN